MDKEGSLKNAIFQKGDIFLEHLNHNNDPLINNDFIKGSLETFDKFFDKEETIKESINNCNDYSIISNKSNNSNGCTKFHEKMINGGNNKYFPLKFYVNNNCSKNDEEKNKNKKQLFNTHNAQNNLEHIVDIKTKKLIMNRESAKKSRLKKKKYIENLEKEFMILKEEMIRLNSLRNFNYKNNLDILKNSEINNNIYENLIKENNKSEFKIKDMNLNLNININHHKDKEIMSLKREEFNIISNNLEKDQTIINKYVNKQKKIIRNLLIKQIDIITPVKFKTFQNKFLKLEDIKEDDSIAVIKNKINNNLEIIIELYDIDINKNEKDNNSNKKNSISNNLYMFYKNLKSFIEQYELIYNQIDFLAK